MCVSPNDLQCSYVAPSGLWFLVGPLVRRGTPTLFCVAPLGLGGGTLSVRIRRLVPKTIVLV